MNRYTISFKDDPINVEIEAEKLYVGEIWTKFANYVKGTNVEEVVLYVASFEILYIKIERNK